MADDLSIILSWFAGFSNFYSILTIIACFIVMVVFILRLNNENLFMNLNATSVQQVNFAVEQCVTGMVNPFAVKMMPNNVSSLRDGIHIQLSLLKRCILHVYWGIDLEEFHKAIQAPWKHILRHLNAKSWLEGHTMFRNEHKELNACDSIQEHLRCPGEITAQDLGESPRKKYPAIIITFLPGFQDEENTRSAKIVAVFSVIHLKDSICQQDSHILNQYLKTSNQELFTLQPLFVPTLPDSPSNESHRTNESTIATTNDSCAENEQRSSQIEPLTAEQNGQQGPTPLGENNGTTCSHSKQEDENVRKVCLRCGKLRIVINEICVECSENLNRHLSSSCNTQDSTGYCDVQSSDNLRQRRRGQEMSANTNPEQDVTSDLEVEDQTWEECIVCQVESVTFALLPCRHACVCGTCFNQLERCPMCRGYIESYFRVRQSSDDDNTADNSPSLNEVPLVPAQESIWERLNHRLNTFLGFS